MQTENMKSFAIAIVATLGFQLATVPAGHAQNAFQCSETISDGRTINGSVVVPANRICTLTNVTVVGNVQVGTGADLNVSGQGGTVKVIGNVRVGTGAALSVMGSSDLTITIDGNVVADQCNFVRFENTMRGAISVEGNVNIQNCTNGSGAGSYFGPITISGNFVCSNNPTFCVADSGVVQGNLTVDDNTDAANSSRVSSNQVSGNVDVSGNSGAMTEVGGNTIGGNLRCSGNSSVTDNGAPNAVGGHKLDQCAPL